MHAASRGVYEITGVFLLENTLEPHFYYEPVPTTELPDGVVMRLLTDPERLSGLAFGRPVPEWLEVVGDADAPHTRFKRVAPHVAFR